MIKEVCKKADCAVLSIQFKYLINEILTSLSL